MWLSIIALVVALVALFLAFAFALALGALAKDLAAFKHGVAAMTEAADDNFASNHRRLGQLEQFIITVFKLDVPGFPRTSEDSKLQDSADPSKKKSDLN
jgi:hypothetical protein